MTVKKSKKVIKKVASSSTAAKVVTVVVNGQVSGTVPATSTIAAAALQVSRDHGLKSYTLKVDGVKLETSHDLNLTLVGHKSIELFAKDSRA